MPKMPPKDAAPREGRKDARKMPHAKPKGADREARLAEALRENLRRRKAPPASEDKKED